MKRIWDKLKNKVTLNKTMILFFTALLIIGVIAGSLFTVMLDSSDKTLVKQYLDSFLGHISNQSLDMKSGFINSLFANLGFVLIIWLLGISVIGFPILLFLFFTKAFTIGFTMGSLCLSFGGKGVLYSFLYLFPHQLFNFILYIILFVYAVSLSVKLIMVIFKKKTIDFKPIMNRYCFILGICLIGMFFSSIYESFIVPFLLKLVL